MVLRTQNDKLALLRGRGDGTFAPDVRLPTARQPSFVTTGDFNTDGVSDVVTLQFQSEWEGRDRKDARVWLGGPGRTTQTLPKGPHGFVATGDLDGDGWTDALSWTPSGDNRIWMNRGGPGGLSARELIATANYYVRSLQILHVDADATLDVVLYTFNATYVLLGNGDGTLRPAVALPLGNSVFHVESGDVNKDGKPDLVLSALSSTRDATEVRLLLGRGDGSFEPPLVLLSIGNTREPRPVLADLDRDGALDVVVMRVEPVVSAGVLMGRGDGSFTSGPTLSLGDDFVGEALGLADLDQDGFPDAVYCGTAPSGPRVLQVLKGTGGGGFTHVGSYPTEASCSGLTLVDMDEDGWPDVLGASWSNDSVSLWKGLGQGVLAPERSFGTYLYYEGIALSLEVLDANGDGRLDIIAGRANPLSALLLQR
ncbi:FG-GAP repeat domain-containing protein [Cystobacter fuscus]